MYGGILTVSEFCSCNCRLFGSWSVIYASVYSYCAEHMGGIILFRYLEEMLEYMVGLACLMERDALLGWRCRLGRSPVVM